MRKPRKRLRGPEPVLGNASDTELIALAPTNEWAFPEFYRRHFFGLAGLLCTRVGDPAIAHDLANEAMSLGLEYAIEPRRSAVVDPSAWIYEIALGLLEQLRSRGTLDRRASARVGLDLVATPERLRRVEAEAERIALIEDETWADT